MSKIDKMKNSLQRLGNKIDGHSYVHKFDHAVVTEYYVGDNCGTSGKIGCMGTTLKENYSCASHNMPCGTKIYIPSLKGVINDTGIFEVEDTGGNACLPNIVIY